MKMTPTVYLKKVLRWEEPSVNALIKLKVPLISKAIAMVCRRRSKTPLSLQIKLKTRPRRTPKKMNLKVNGNLRFKETSLGKSSHSSMLKNKRSSKWDKKLTSTTSLWWRNKECMNVVLSLDKTFNWRSAIWVMDAGLIISSQTGFKLDSTVVLRSCWELTMINQLICGVSPVWFLSW